MRYSWSDFCLDRRAATLTRHGREIDITRKAFDCISCLIEHRDRVTGYDELIQRIWGHTDVTNHQLSQVILAARRAIGDDGRAQRLIRTVPGVGYRWIGALDDIPPAAPDAMATHPASLASPPGAAASDASSAGGADGAGRDTVALLAGIAPDAGARPRTAVPPVAPRGRFRWVATAMASAALLALLSSLGRGGDAWPWSHRTDATGPAQRRASATTSLPALWEAFWRGRYEEVRNGLAMLPPDISDAADARLLEIYLDIDRGRFARAATKLETQRLRADAAGDALWQARLLVAASLLNGTSGRSGEDVLAPARAAVDRLEHSATPVPPARMGEALSARGYGYMKVLSFEPAVRDLVRARELLLEGGDARGAADAMDTLARIHMRMGRFAEALDLLEDVAGYSRRADVPVQEILAVNAATKIDLEMLRWNDALAHSDRAMALLKRVPLSERRTRVLQLRAHVMIGLGRLREAGSLIEEADTMRDDRYSPIIDARYRLATGDAAQALATATRAIAFPAYNANDPLNLESREGAMLLWTIAAQRIADDGGRLPTPTPEQLAILRRPTSTVGMIARGRWLWSTRQLDQAETALRVAAADARRAGHPAQLLAAAEPLAMLMLQRGRIDAAKQVVADLWADDPVRMSGDYAANVLALRIALASNDGAAVQRTLGDLRTLAGERALPSDLRAAVAARVADTPARPAAGHSGASP